MKGFVSKAAAIVVVFAAQLGCGDDDSQPPADVGCPANRQIADVCAGVPSQPLCEGAICTDGVTCTTVVEVADDATLTSAAASAQPGSCIALRPGSYADAVLPGGVSLLGRSAADVHVNRVELGPGEHAVVRGMTVGAGGIGLDATQDATVDAVEVRNSSTDGIRIQNGGSASVLRSSILGSTLYGVSAFDTGPVTIDASFIEGSRGPGFWAQCATGCDCSARPNVSVARTVLRDSKIVGVSAVGVNATLHDVRISDNSEADDFAPGGGISAAGCTVLEGTSIAVTNNTWFGILVDGSSATLGGQSEASAIEITECSPGMWVQNLSPTGDQPVKLEHLELTNNSGVGLGVSGESKGIIFWNSAITGTKLLPVPVLKGGAASSENVGDGIAWLEASQLDIDGVTLSGNERASILIDGTVADGSTIANVTLSGGDEAKGIVQQNLPMSMAITPATENAPAVMSSADEQFAVPIAPAAPDVPSGI